MRVSKLLSALLIILTGLLFLVNRKWVERDRKKLTELLNVIQLENVSDSDAIHIAVLISGINTCNQFLVLMKTLLFQVGHFDTNRCEAPPMVRQVVTCSNTYTPLVFHLIADTEAQMYLQSHLLKWKHRDLSMRYYNITQYMKMVRTFQSSHYSGSRSYIKLLLPDILPPSVEKVIMMDADMLMNKHICELWDHFNQFTSTQIFAMVRETAPYYRKYLGRKYWPSLVS
ncbi:hypothetical protein PHET_08383 [Paragonimus heterotremus]|uniref:Hexosyltransferase n=1 Tax=Paragonimus heterotremus TaxID=100268 RepID=A0A8J4T5T8_9TREM|nr:hypothetical protein PHET_08383 [Paragonimus heterotremus]